MATPIATLRALSDLAPLLDRLRSEGLRRRGLTLPRQRLLLLLHAEGPLVSVDVAQRTGVSPRAVTPLVDGLVEAGLARRVPHPTDRRSSLVELTAEGSRLAAEIQQAHDAFADDLLGDVPEADLATTLAVVEHVRAQLEARAAATR